MRVATVILLMLNICSAYAIEIVLTKPIYRGNTGFSLSEIAQIKALNNEDAANLKNINIFWPNNKRWVTQHDIQEIIISSGVLKSTNFTVSGLKQVWLQLCFKPDMASFIEEVKVYINNELTVNNARLTSVEIIDAEVCLNEDSEDLQINNNKNNYWLQNQRLNFLTRDGEAVSYLFKLGYEQEQIILNRFIAIGERVNTHDYDLHWNQVKRVSMNKQVSLKDGLKALQDLEKGTILNFSNVKPFPEIAKGEWITLQLKQNGFLIEAKVKALGDGYLGKDLDVILEKGSKVLTTTVVNRGVVSVSF